jgi:hypothetical protein
MITYADLSLYELEGDLETLIERLTTLKEEGYEKGFTNLQVEVEDELDAGIGPFVLLRGQKG